MHNFNCSEYVKINLATDTNIFSISLKSLSFYFPASHNTEFKVMKFCDSFVLKCLHCLKVRRVLVDRAHYRLAFILTFLCP